MGYYVNGRGNVRILREDLDKAYEALMALQERTELMGGGTFSAKESKRHFAWMPDELRTLPDVKSVFESLGFEVEETDVALYIKEYDSKIGDEKWFFAAAAPYMYGEFEWVGEDGEEWMWKFDKGVMTEHAIRKSFDDEGTEVKL